MISSTDHFSLKTGAAPIVTLSKAGAVFGPAAGAVSEIASGWYKVVLSTVDSETLGDLAYYITGTGADDTDFCDQVSARILDDLMPTYTQPAGFLAATFPPDPADQSLIIGVANAILADTNLLSAAQTESYAADGAEGTIPQLLYMILALLSEKSISGTTLTAKKLDGVTTAGTFTLSDAISPVSITRTT